VIETRAEPEQAGVADDFANAQKQSGSVGPHGKTFEVYMVYGTKGDEALNPRYRPIGAELAKKIRELPLRLVDYYLVCSKRCRVPQQGSRMCALDDNCEFEITDSADSQVDVLVTRKGIRCGKRRQLLAKGEFLVFGGNAPNSSCWLVFVKRVD
jgi:hypothetical protein